MGALVLVVSKAALAEPEIAPPTTDRSALPDTEQPGAHPEEKPRDESVTTDADGATLTRARETFWEAHEQYEAGNFEAALSLFTKPVYLCPQLDSLPGYTCTKDHLYG